MKKPPFQIINAAAGSGKTFSLVLHFLERLLSSKESSPYRHLLVLTFTNKAVNEVKARILKCLNVLATTPEKEQVILSELLKRLDLTTFQLQERAERMLRKILQEYGYFDVLTLDKFTHRIIRTFAKDFKLPFGFEVAIDSKGMLSDMVTSIIDRVGKDPNITERLYAYSLGKVLDERSWDIQKDLLDFANILLKENDRIPLAQLKSKTSARLNQDKNYLETLLGKMKTHLIQMATDTLELIVNNGLEKGDFFKGTLYNHFEKIKKLNFDRLYENQLALALEKEKPLYTKKLDPQKQDSIEGIREELHQRYLTLKAKVGETLLTESILKNWPPLSLLHIMEKALEDVQNEHQRILLAQFNKKISSVIVDQPAPFIYERLGERYRHYFIDEFQDTSELQWKNLIPLIANALETEELAGQAGSLLLVGDPKQAIYRWRGGNISQFLSLLEKQSPFQIQPEIKILPKNYRSKDQIVTFNTNFFNLAGNYLQDPAVRELFSEGSKQQTNDKPGGYVHVDFIPKTKTKEEAIPFYLQKTIEAIRKAQANNFKNKDIVILVRKKKQATQIGKGLSQEGIPILSSESLLLKEAPSIQFLIALFRLTKLPNDKQQHKIILDHVWLHTQNSWGTDYHTFLHLHLQLPTKDLFSRLKFDFDFDRFKSFSLFNALEMAILCFPFLERTNTYIVYFLENIFEFTTSKSTSFSAYLQYWEEQSDTFHIAMPEGLDAVQLMTIHKAKGLEFPVVILPFLEEPFQPEVRYKIWLSLNEAPLERLDWGWINFSSKMKLMGEDATERYDSEVLTNELDAYTVLYVAMTRAEEQLYIITKQLDKEERSSAYLFHLFAADQGVDLSLNSSFDWGNQTREELEDKKQPEEASESIPFPLSISTSTNWQNRLIAQFDTAIEFSRDEREWGILIHQLLRGIRHADALDYALQEAQEMGQIQEEEQDELKVLLKQVVYHPQLYPFFSSSGNIYNEHDILVPDGTTLRPDRVVQLDEVTALIDYKTGKPKAKDKQQLEAYESVIKQMGFETVQKYLVYIQNEVSVVHF